MRTAQLEAAAKANRAQYAFGNKAGAEAAKTMGPRYSANGLDPQNLTVSGRIYTQMRQVQKTETENRQQDLQSQTSPLRAEQEVSGLLTRMNELAQQASDTQEDSVRSSLNEAFQSLGSEVAGLSTLAKNEDVSLIGAAAKEMNLHSPRSSRQAASVTRDAMKLLNMPASSSSRSTLPSFSPTVQRGIQNIADILKSSG